MYQQSKGNTPLHQVVLQKPLYPQKIRLQIVDGSMQSIPYCYLKTLEEYKAVLNYADCIGEKNIIFSG